MIVNRIRSCPICNERELSVTSKSVFDKLYVENGDATISIECRNCSLQLYEHKYHGKSYKTKLNKLIDKWNSMPRLEDTDDGK